jgi:surface antigen
MLGRFSAGALLALATIAGPVSARTTIDFDDASGGGGLRLPGYLQCVPYARQVSGIQIFGDARTWWDQAEGRYARGHAPRVGAVMAFRPYGAMRLGHVAAVSDILDSRTVLLRHANWSPINGRRGQIEDDVRAIDVSPNNDWSQVRVWFAPIRALGGTSWPVSGFIYNQKPDDRNPGLLNGAPAQLVRAEPYKQLAGTQGLETVQLMSYRTAPGARTQDRAQVVQATPYKALPATQADNSVQLVRATPYKVPGQAQPAKAVRTDLRMAMSSDPIGDIIARRSR